MAEKTKRTDKKGNIRDLVYKGVAEAIGKAYNLDTVERVAQGIKLELNGETIILRAIVKKEPVTETPKEVYEITG